MPVTDILAPLDVDAADRARRYPRLRLRDRGGMAAMPACIEGDALGPGKGDQRLHFRHGGARRLFQEDMLARQDRLPRRLVADLRRLAEDDGVHVRLPGDRKSTRLNSSH